MFRKNLEAKALLFAVLFTQLSELVLLQRKYDLFTGGFLQLHSYITWTERTRFIGFSAWMDMAFWGFIGWVWFVTARKFKCRHLMVVYCFLFFACVSMGAWLSLKYEVLSYFNDTINFIVISNLGGGSLVEAFTYIANEAVYIGVVFFCLIVFFCLGLRLVRQKLKGMMIEDSSVYFRTNPWFACIMFVVTIGVTSYVNSDDGLHYGLIKKTSYQIICKTLNVLTDFDGDGYGMFSFPPDPAPFNAAIYPGALDIPDNGIDEDGFGGDFHYNGPAPDTLKQQLPRSGNHIVLIVLESARAELLDKKWEGRTVAPNMNAMAAAGTAASHAYTHTAFTTSSIKALFNRTLSDGHDRLSLVEYLEQAGYQLSFISGQDESFGDIASAVGMTRHGHYLFDGRSAQEDRVYASKAAGSIRLSEDRIIRQFAKRVGEVNWKTPQFFYINLQAAHFPYHYPKMPLLINDRPIPRSEIKAENRVWLEATYWNAIAVADQAIGSLVDQLKKMGVYEKTTIMIIGDHGESLFDDRLLGHGHALNAIQTRIPLIINQPKFPIMQAVGQVDAAEILVQAATEQYNSGSGVSEDRAVFQYIGSLDKPQLIGIVRTGEERTILDLRSRTVFFSDLNRWIPVAQTWDDPNLGKRVKLLIEKWETTRWENHLSRGKGLGAVNP